MTAADLQRWRQHPVSRLVRHYLHKSIEVERGLLVDAILVGTVTAEAQATHRTRIVTMISLSELEFEEIFNFYDEYADLRPTNDTEETL